MENTFTGKVFVTGDNIDTDQIIPAQYLVFSLDDEEERKEYGRKALSGLQRNEYSNLPFVKKGEDKSEYEIIIAGENFGCGSSREHAPAALQIAGVRFIVAASFARIFYRNCIDGGFLIPVESEDLLIDHFSAGETAVIDIERSVIRKINTKEEFSLRPLGAGRDIVLSGGIFGYAREYNII